MRPGAPPTTVTRQPRSSSSPLTSQMYRSTPAKASVHTTWITWPGMQGRLGDAIRSLAPMTVAGDVRRPLRGRPDLLTAAVCAPIAAALGLLSTHGATLAALVLAGALVLLLTLHRPVHVALLATAACFYVKRLGAGAGGNGISVADVVLAGAVVVAVPAVVGTLQLRRTSGALRGFGVYLGAIGLGVVAHPASRTFFEWGSCVRATPRPPCDW
jgi:hypothetical protein